MSRQAKNRVYLQVEALEARDAPAVASLWVSGAELVVQTDDVGTAVTVRQDGSDIQVREGGTSRAWNYAADSIASIEFQGGAGNDRFENDVALLSIRASGGAGNDYLKGHNGADVLVGGDGDDTLVGFGGDDQMWGDAGNDVLLGMGGNDTLVGGDGDDQLNGREGADRMSGGNGNDVLVAIDGDTRDLANGDAGADVIWADRNGRVFERPAGVARADRVQYVAFFTNGADRTLDGDRITDPTPISGTVYEPPEGGSALFSSAGPEITDIRQGSVGDCWLLAGLGAIALDNPNAIRRNVVDLNDGTYGVRLGNKFFRVDDDLPVRKSAPANGNYVLVAKGTTTVAGAKLGAENSLWPALVEKAYTHYRTGANTYASLDGGWSIEVNRAFRTASPGDRAIWSFAGPAALARAIYQRWSTDQAVTIGTTGKKATAGDVPLLMPHMYTVYSVERNLAGAVTAIILRNPMGYDGTGNDANPSDGLVSVTPGQLFNMIGRVNWGRV